MRRASEEAGSRCADDARREAPRAPVPDGLGWLRGGGEMAEQIRRMDWSATPLGAIEAWPQSLRTTVSLCLASNFPISLTWGPHHVQIYNDGYWPICGAKHPHSMGQDFRVCWASAWPAIGEAFERALAGNTSFLENQRMFLDRNGYLEETFFTFSFSPIRDETGGVGGLFHPVTETTARMLSERRLRALRDVETHTSEARSVEEACALTTKTLADHGLDLPFALLYLVGDDARARLAGATGLDPGAPASPVEIELSSREEAGWPLARAAETGVPELVGDLDRRFGALLAGPYPEPVRAAFVLPIRPAGLERTLGWLVAGVSPRLPLDDLHRGFYALLGSAVSAAMTNARAYQEERLRAEALAELDRAKTAFFSNVSHEFRTPLTLSLGPIEDALASPARALAGADLELVHRNNLRLLKLVNTLLDFSRIEAGRMDARYEPLDLARVTTELASTFRSAVERAGLELVIDAPPLGEDVYVDPEMWEKIILNLLSNALKFTLEGRISVRVRLDGEHALVEVRDTGTGIPAPDLPRIFERFHRLRGAGARTHEGTGIGLALVRELVRLHGGEIQAQSAPGVGTSFVVSLPRGRAHLADDRIGAARALGSSAGGVAAFREEALRWGPSVSAPPAAMQPCAVECILVADDNADMRAYVERLLGRSFRVVAVADGSAALRAALAEPPDLVLSDVMMPGLDGFALLRALRADARTRTVPVVLLSARAGEEAVLEGLDAGADDYLVKPFSARELLARVRVNVVMARERKARAAAEEASRLKDEFLATISHELRTPLTTVLAWAAILSRAPRDAATMARGLALIARNARTQAAIVEDLLDISHLVAGRLHLERRATDLRVLLSEALDAAAAPAAGKRITLIRPDADASFPLVADPARLRQAIDAVLANAIKFTPPGGLVRASVERTAGVVFVRVSDTGEGIAPTRMAHIFDRFHQGDGSAKRPHGGLGLGLAIARALVSLHGGAVSAESEGAGRGATFTLSLPTADAPLDASLTQRR